ncbi:dnaJ homolog subfamily C member 14-like isoform X2 [Quercus lobata]|uniref:dnaJ homolog subfamily C member 14-like isoform X2 n=1 Tax=Quercus lobata TaxID=97700 RepID=UPI001245428B|nr:dnaJ homolog subfamily C member 14-like isoform X2 [Quercus lobata]XP_030963417.1 dnaJ homolog subfamily C member 14-like isoform X2 [Quercus lobata]XP_030963418.1 dnaJ homolog subfamily C member 14-like isoform X2 [Quercus lobata]
MKRIFNCVDHYEALGFPCHKTIDTRILNQEYWKKAMLVHPDKNMGCSQASESFKKLQCAYEGNQDYHSEELRRIQCTKCGLSHIRVCTSRSKAKARWCQDCCQYHQAKDGELEMDGLNTEARWYLNVLKRWKYHVLLSVLRAKSLMYQNGLSVREWLVGPTLISPASM